MSSIPSTSLYSSMAVGFVKGSMSAAALTSAYLSGRGILEQTEVIPTTERALTTIALLFTSTAAGGVGGSLLAGIKHCATTCFTSRSSPTNDPEAIELEVLLPQNLESSI